MYFPKLYTLLVCLSLMGCNRETVPSNGVPEAPSWLTASVASSVEVYLQWSDNSQQENGFQVQRRTATAGFETVGSTPSNVTIFQDAGLTPNTVYTYRVNAYNASGSSVQYSNEVTVTTPSDYSYTPGPVVTDVNGNIYPSFRTSCGQTWTSKNLNVSLYRNGDIIPQVTGIVAWMTATTGAWCWYNNDSTFFGKYGKMYNWYAVTDPRGLAPAGWHVPSDAEWKTLIRCIDIHADTAQAENVSAIAGGAMKTNVITDWGDNVGSTNSSGFSGLPGGKRFSNGDFGFEYFLGCWWSNREQNITNAFHFSLDAYSNGVFRTYDEKVLGLSVRVVKD